MSSGKAPGSDAIPAEIYKAVGCRETDRVGSHYVEKRSHPSRIQGCNNYPNYYSKEKEILKKKRLEKSPGSATITNRSPFQTPRGRGNRQIQTSTKRTNVRKALKTR